MRAVATDVFCNCWYLEIPSDNHAQGLRLHRIKLTSGVSVRILVWLLRQGETVAKQECPHVKKKKTRFHPIGV
jgi:hypothetical protein